MYWYKKCCYDLFSLFDIYYHCHIYTWFSIAQSVCQRAFSLLEIRFQRPWIRITGSNPASGRGRQHVSFRKPLACTRASKLTTTNMYTTYWSWQNGCHLTDNFFMFIFMKENVCILLQISLYFVPMGPLNEKVSIVSGNGLGPNRQQAITWTNTDSYGFPRLPWVKDYFSLSKTQCAVHIS